MSVTEASEAGVENVERKKKSRDGVDCRFKNERHNILGYDYIHGKHSTRWQMM